MFVYNIIRILLIRYKYCIASYFRLKKELDGQA